jgi:hypothetical protein
MTVSVSIDGMRANSAGGGKTWSFTGGLEMGSKTEIAPLGVGAEMSLLDVSATATYWQESPNNTPTASADKNAESGYDITFSIEKSITTSAEPGTAGRASDIILGGGLELLFVEVVYVAQKKADGVAVDGVCLDSTKNLAWEPSKLTTFVLPVEQILNEMIRIKAQQTLLNENSLDVERVAALVEGHNSQYPDNLITGIQRIIVLFWSSSLTQMSTHIRRTKDKRNG